MSYEFRYPKIIGLNERDQLREIKSYLHQLVDQLQWAFNDIDKNSITTTPQSLAKTKSSSVATLGLEGGVDAGATFNAIKGLIIKSADVVNAFYEEINRRLQGVYVAESDFGTYMEHTTQEISESSTDIERIFTNIQTILTDIDNLEYKLVETNAHIKSGLLYYDNSGIPIYGLEIGQRTMIDGAEVFDKFARFTSDRLSFYDQNDNEVAYISDRKLFITHIEVTGTFKMGGFVKNVLADGSIVKRWVNAGGEE